MERVVTVQVSELAAPEPEAELAPFARTGLDARPGRNLLDDPLARRLSCGHECLLWLAALRLQAQANLKSKAKDAFLPNVASLLTIGEVSRRSGVASSALRFYEERGLIFSERAGSGHRRYPRHALRRIAFIVFAQRVGLTLEEIGTELAKLPPHCAPTHRDWARLSGSWTARIDERIAELERLRRGLTECIGCGCLSLERCGSPIRATACTSRSRAALLDRTGRQATCHNRVAARRHRATGSRSPPSTASSPAPHRLTGGRAEPGP